MAKLPNSEPLHVLRGLRQCYNHCFLLESASQGRHRLGRYSFLGFDPETFIEIKGRKATINGKTEKIDDPFELLDEYAQKYHASSQFPFLGGLVGAISYDAIRTIEDIPQSGKNDLNHPEFAFGLYTDGIIIDRYAGMTYYFSLDQYRYNDVKKAIQAVELQAAPENVQNEKPLQVTVNQSKTAFMNNVSTAKERLTRGEIFQTVLSQRFDIQSKLDPVVFYEKLREINPSDYMYFLDFEPKIIGASPESLVKKNGSLIETNPIAGSRPRGCTPDEDCVLHHELLKSEKENAEHVMLVDLGRNDLGKVSEYGSVQVPMYKHVEKYSHVQHMVSRVTGQLRKEYTAMDAFKACFPAGTVSGAPKVRAMELIDELEPTQRGLYAGCVGYISTNGAMDFAITLRTATHTNGTYNVQAGAGVVIDSDPEQEYQETISKASALFQSLGVSNKDLEEVLKS